jgi:hypothetical protein
MKLAASELGFLSSYLSVTRSSSNNPVSEEMKSSFVPEITKESCVEVHNAVLATGLLTYALDIALRWAFCSDWKCANAETGVNDVDEEAIACTFVASFMNFDFSIKREGMNRLECINTVLKALGDAVVKNQSTTSEIKCINPSRRAWFVDAEFNVLKFLCRNQTPDQKLISVFSFSLLGRLGVGDEALAGFIFENEKLFQVNDIINGVKCEHLANATFLQNVFLKELNNPDERKSQMNHSLHLNKMSTSGRLSTLRSGFSSGGQAEKAVLLPLGSTWLLNVLSSTTIDSGAACDDMQSARNTIDIISHALALVLNLEFPSSYTCNMNNGRKLYHLANVCLYPEGVLRENFVHTSVTCLYKHYVMMGSKTTLVRDFISACHHHSRLSKTEKNRAGRLVDLIDGTQDESSIISSEQLRALDDFVGDMCDSYIEWGAQYDVFSNFMRFFLRTEFPSKIISSVLSKLHPVLNVLTLDEDRDATFSSLVCSVSGGLPSFDNTQRDHSSVLDSMSDVLKKRDRELSRNDYIYLLAVSVLSRNLSSSVQRCECGVEAMKHRLSGIQESILYDIIRVCEVFLGGDGSKDTLIHCVMDICLNEKEGLNLQPESVQLEWKSIAGKEQEVLWNKAMSCLISECNK